MSHGSYKKYMGWVQTLSPKSLTWLGSVIPIIITLTFTTPCSARMAKTRRQVKVEVCKRVKDEVITSLTSFVRRQNPALWGMKRSRTFVGDLVLVTLYKDLFAIGYHTLCGEVKVWLPLAERTMRHNMKELRRLFSKWAEERIKRGNLPEWKEAARGLKFSKELKGVCLWMDSSNFPLIGKEGASRKKRTWSFKLNGPGRRYMVLMDGEGKVRSIWGGYSPKVYDGDFLELNKKWLEKKLEGATVVADTHFEWGSKHLEHVDFKTPIPQPRGRRKLTSDRVKIPKKLTHEQEKYNTHVYSAQSRVENPFGRMEAKVDALTKPWREGKTQLDYLVLLAAALINSG